MSSTSRFCSSLHNPCFSMKGAGAANLLSSSRAVDGEIEDMEIAQIFARGAGGIIGVERAVENERHAALREAAVGTQPRAGKRREVVRGRRGADAGFGVADDDHVAFAVERQLEQA